MIVANSLFDYSKPTCLPCRIRFIGAEMMCGVFDRLCQCIGGLVGNNIIAKVTFSGLNLQLKWSEVYKFLVKLILKIFKKLGRDSERDVE
jgi:hypothetical protein